MMSYRTVPEIHETSDMVLKLRNIKNNLGKKLIDTDCDTDAYDRILYNYMRTYHAIRDLEEDLQSTNVCGEDDDGDEDAEDILESLYCGKQTRMIGFGTW